ncbi:hypothetical protein [Amycolatopsis cihanbeyliensis]|uniref:Integral membrane protein n=1 Tax=Amycolatopsis cihanbeyliensis TaxID=1128664 RepID=A0A542DHL4_AMYCI|nr:hypothetical protein [Amycolatopsis cihanbeyliensis]TQJ02526.1 hypothetical protein FB471_2257 [Amycolatopsis cihanbeyliensis]
MPFTDKISPAPGEVRLAGVLTALPGLAMLALAALLVVSSFSGTSEIGGNNVYAEAGYYFALAAGTLACAAGLLLGKTWARSPGVVVALIMAGVGWYATGPSGRPGFGIPLIAVGVLTVVLLFRRRSRAWVLGQEDGESEEEAARRDGAAGRAARREREEDG